MSDMVKVILAILAVLAVLVVAVGLMWWSTGQFFTGSQHWAAFWILIILSGSSSNRCKK